MRTTKIVLLTAMLMLLPALATAGDATIKLPSSNGADAFVIQDKYGTPLMSVDSYGDTTVKNLSVSDPSSVGNIHLFLASETVKLWGTINATTDGTSGGPYIQDLTGIVPSSAKGAVLKVIVNTKSQATATFTPTGSFVVSDRLGNFCAIEHYLCNGFTNYSNFWIGGTVYAPFITGTKTFKWRMSSNVASVDNLVFSYGGLIGWF